MMGLFIYLPVCIFVSLALGVLLYSCAGSKKEVERTGTHNRSLSATFDIYTIPTTRQLAASYPSFLIERCTREVNLPPSYIEVTLPPPTYEQATKTPPLAVNTAMKINENCSVK